MAHGKKCWSASGVEWPTIRPGSESWSEWREYFTRHLGWMPSQMACVIADHERSAAPTKVMTVPAVWPVHLDPTFQPDPHWTEPPLKHRNGNGKSTHETLDQLKARLGPTWGIGSAR
jgi:hypothetical protein